MAAIKTTAQGKIWTGASPRAVTAAGMAKTPPPTIDLTSETMDWGRDDFFVEDSVIVVVDVVDVVMDGEG